MATHNNLGTRGEDLAYSLLISKGYDVVERNWRCGKLEIDLIAVKDRLLVVIEVKTRSSELYGKPELSVGGKKENFLKYAIESYMESNKVNLPIRFDIISIILEMFQVPRMRHLKSAF